MKAWQTICSEKVIYSAVAAASMVLAGTVLALNQPASEPATTKVVVKVAPTRAQLAAAPTTGQQGLFTEWPSGITPAAAAAERKLVADDVLLSDAGASGLALPKPKLALVTRVAEPRRFVGERITSLADAADTAVAPVVANTEVAAELVDLREHEVDAIEEFAMAYQDQASASAADSCAPPGVGSLAPRVDSGAEASQGAASVAQQGQPPDRQPLLSLQVTPTPTPAARSCGANGLGYPGETVCNWGSDIQAGMCVVIPWRGFME